MPWYRNEGKIQTPLSDQDFLEGMSNGYFVQEKHKGLVALYYYSAVRKTEASRALREQFSLNHNVIYFSVGKRLKHGIETPSLNIPLKLPFASNIWDAVEATRPGEAVFPYSPKTDYNIVHRVFKLSLIHI